MSDLIKLLEKYNVGDVLIILILSFLAVKGIITEINNIKTKLKKNREEYHEQESDKEDEKEKIEDRLTSLEEKVKSIDEIMDIVKSIKSCQDDNQESRRKATVATCRSSLQLLTDKVLEKGYMTQIEYETFDDLAEVYLANRGNHTMKDKVIPKVRKLPVYTEQELANMK